MQLLIKGKYRTIAFCLFPIVIEGGIKIRVPVWFRGGIF